jgi:ectoine hydroxylase
MIPTAESLASSIRVTFDEPPRATLACVQLPTDLTLDAEGPALLSRIPGVRLRLQKIPLDGDSLDIDNYESARGRIAGAAGTLRPTGSIDVIGLACTSLAFALGREHVQAELREAHPSALVTDMASSMLAALDFLGVKRLALLTPYVGELHERNLELLRSSGREVVSDHYLGLTTDEEITAVSPQTILELVKAVDVESADALIIGCSAFRACTPGLLDELEQKLGKPIVSSQQAFLWNLLRLAGIEDRIGGYGALFSRATKRSEAHHSSPAHPSGDSKDIYPSRVLTPGLVPRLDPVVAVTARSCGPLSATQVDSFETRGVLVCRQVFSPPEVDSLLRTTVALRDHYESLTYEELDRGTDMRVITERGGSLVDGGDHPPTLKSIWQVHLPQEHAPHMLFAADLSRRTVCDARLVYAARQLLGEDVYVHQSRINYQRGISERSRGGSGFLWHQDFEQWHSEDGMPRMRAVSMAVLLEPARPTNGALMVMPGSHRQMVQALGDPSESERYAKGALSSGPKIPVDLVRSLADEHGIEHCSGEAGDVVLFDCNTMHGSHTNISPWGRSMLFTVYNAVSNTPAKQPFGSAKPRPEHIGSHDPRFAGVALPALQQSLARPTEKVSTRAER